MFDTFIQNRNFKSIDLHGFYVDEAIELVLMAIDYIHQEIDRTNIVHLNQLMNVKRGQYALYEVITGKGLHSLEGKSRLRPALVNKFEEMGQYHEVMTDRIVIRIPL